MGKPLAGKRFFEALGRRAYTQGLHGTWHCTRIWEAWHVGTMSQDDFEPVDESETPTEIADAVLALLAAPPTAQAADIVTAPAGATEMENLQRTAVGWQERALRAERNWVVCRRWAIAGGAPVEKLGDDPDQPFHPAQADSVPAVSDLPPLPDIDLRDVGTKPQEIKEFLKGYATEYARTAIAARAPADSVQEDAALWHWLAEYLVGTRTDLDDEIVASETVNDLRKLVEAARKQGGV